MAAVLDLPPTHATVVRDVIPARNDRVTQYDTPDIFHGEEPEFSWQVLTRRRRTASAIEQGERGRQYDSESNVGQFHNGVTQIAPSEEVEVSDGQSLRVRSELVRDIRNRINDLMPLIGDVAFATEVQLFKRDLARCHDVLRDCPTEANFLSIVTLIESSTSQRKWRDYSSDQLNLIRSAVDIGYRQTRVSFSDSDSIRRRFSDEGIDTHPRIDLDSLNLTDVTDDEEKEE